MRGNKRSNTKPEMIVRSLLHAAGYRYRLHASDLPGRPDIVFRSRKKVIFVHGCFWHQHPEQHCRLRKPPRTNTSYWGPKLTRNVQRDVANQMALASREYAVLVIWECELRYPVLLRSKLETFLGPPRRA
ncbi:very short patch repair endonuclease [Lutibaculum baratangense]|uniref:very short patch repair endonuclease n=1 Tax=Lutibaculum baratangense TaxID=1358440 RepID=UPI0009DCDB71|nr:very short patch repair endonuclease [Lutibaculum baratangense]